SETKAAIGEKATKKSLTSQRGTSPAALAEMFGFDTVEEMFEELRTLKGRDAWARERALEEMDRRHPSYDQERQRLKDMIADSMHSEESAKWLLKEIAMLRKKIEPEAWDNWHKEFAQAPEQQIK